MTTDVEGGVVGVIMDARGRPLVLPEDAKERRRRLLRWFSTLDAYPEASIERYGEDLGESMSESIRRKGGNRRGTCIYAGAQGQSLHDV